MQHPVVQNDHLASFKQHKTTLVDWCVHWAFLRAELVAIRIDGKTVRTRDDLERPILYGTVIKRGPDGDFRIDSETPSRAFRWVAILVPCQIENNAKLISKLRLRPMGPRQNC